MEPFRNTAARAMSSFALFACPNRLGTMNAASTAKMPATSNTSINVNADRLRYIFRRIALFLSNAEPNHSNSIAHCQLPIANCMYDPLMFLNWQLEIGNWQSQSHLTADPIVKMGSSNATAMQNTTNAITNRSTGSRIRTPNSMDRAVRASFVSAICTSTVSRLLLSSATAIMSRTVSGNSPDSRSGADNAAPFFTLSAASSIDLARMSLPAESLEIF